ncbi:4-vinyl reductase [bacterium]|nr:4-vinyl reductase [bacterium]MBU1153242.1 4-vinyl reductase [bacterium]MBU1782029.1 4-vinyl reductase [bacterium]
MEFKLTFENLGNIAEGRPTLGTETPVLNYRILQFSLREVIESELGEGKGAEYLYRAGKLAGTMVYQKFFADIKELDELIKKVIDLLYQLKMCILRIEKCEPEKGVFVFIALEDLDCSGVPKIGWPICQYDEGFISAILSIFTGKNVVVKEVDCWATGERFCRLEAKVVE